WSPVPRGFPAINHDQELSMRLQLAAVLGLMLASPGLAQNPEAAKKDDQQKVDSQGQKKTPAARVDFKKELNLPYNSLSTLGARIDTARRGHDPVALAHAASELSVAEKVSGKKAGVTASTLMTESAQLAQLRRQADELQAVQQVAQQVAAETDLVTSLKKQILLSQQQAKDETDALRRNEEPTDAPRKILVNN